MGPEKPTKVGKTTFLAPGSLNRNKSVKRLRSSFLTGFSSGGGNMDLLLGNKEPSSSTRDGNVASQVQDLTIMPSPTNEVGRDVTPSTRNESATEDVNLNSDSLTPEQDSEPIITKRKKKGPQTKNRGVNKCSRVANLKDGEKMQVQFYNNGPVGDYQADMVRHMGMLVRDRLIVPVRVRSWDEIDSSIKEHLWRSVLNKFGGDGMDLERKTTLEHMKRLWQNWRGLMKRDNINKKGSIKEALEEVPNHVTKDEWTWLVNEYYTSKSFKKVSGRNSENRGNLKMPHRTGSRPFRQVIRDDMGGKDGKQPLISEVFERTRRRKCGTLEEESALQLIT